MRSVSTTSRGLRSPQAQASRYADTAALFQSLGGGWWTRPAAADGATPVTQNQPAVLREREARSAD